MAKETIKQQIRACLDRYDDEDPHAAMLSGMSLVATYLAKADGSETITPQMVATAVAEVGAERGFEIGRL